MVVVFRDGTTYCRKEISVLKDWKKPTAPCYNRATAERHAECNIFLLYYVNIYFAIYIII